MGRKATRIKLYGNRYNQILDKYQPESIKKLETSLHLFFEFKGIINGNVDQLLAKIPVGASLNRLFKLTPIVEEDIVNFTIWLKKKKPNYMYGGIRSTVMPLIQFYKYYGLEYLNSKGRVSSHFPEKDHLPLQAYTFEQVEAMYEVSLSHPDERATLVLLLYATTGIRRGALSTLQIRHLRYFEKEKQYILTVYGNISESSRVTEHQYMVPLTPQLSDKLTAYFERRKHAGEVLKGNSPVIRENYNRTDPTQWQLRPIHVEQARSIVQELRKYAKIYEPVHGKPQGSIHTDIPIVHAFRYFFTNQGIKAERVGMSMRFNRIFKGHKLTVEEKHYVKTGKDLDQQLLDEYKYLIPFLTFGKAERELTTELVSTKDELAKVKEDYVKRLEYLERAWQQKLNEPIPGTEEWLDKN